MMTEHSTALPRAAFILNSGVLLNPVALGFLFALLIKAINPSNVDVSQGLAYLQPILIVAYSLVGLSFLVTLLMNTALTRRHNPWARGLWFVFGTQAVLTAIIVAIQLTDRSISGST